MFHVRPPPKLKTLSHEQAMRFYDRMAAIQDAQYFIERPALADLVANLELAGAGRLIEFGCGTGRFVEELFDRYLPLDACYIGFDASSTMIELAQSRTARFGNRAVIRQTSGTMRTDLPDGTFDRFISTYVLDLLSEEDIDSLLSEAYRVLRTGGLLGLVSQTKGSQGLSRLVMSAWERLHRFSPILTGGCRPIVIGPLLKNLMWKVRHRNVVSPFAIASEIVIAEKI
jgi:ubiquinone/menaquinone biosynthesis C-methylase UbiE